MRRVRLFIPIKTQEELDKLLKFEEEVDSFLRGLIQYLFPNKRFFNFTEQISKDDEITRVHFPILKYMTHEEASPVYGVECDYRIED